MDVVVTVAFSAKSFSKVKKGQDNSLSIYFLALNGYFLALQDSMIRVKTSSNGSICHQFSGHRITARYKNQDYGEASRRFFKSSRKRR
jgi:hypothetical protein